MKTSKLYTSIFLALTALSAIAQQELPAGVSPAWYAQVTSTIQQQQYDFRTNGSPLEYTVVNPKNQLKFAITHNGYTVQNIKKTTADVQWEAGFVIVGTGRKNAIKRSTGNFTVTKSASSILYNSPSYNVQYVNDEKGMRQNFIIRQRPAGVEDLSVSMLVTSSLTVKSKGTNQLVFHTKDNSKDVKLVYDDLKVWDADHKILPAKMELNEITNTVTISVDDNNAVYPVTIDPLNRNAEWSTSADGVLPGLLTNLQLQVQTTYGYTVAGLGDINGDNFDDVAISAPTMADVITGSGNLAGVGAVFIYLGSPTGLPALPNKILQPTTAVEGALFGFSVDAGDITGDGRNDIVIGAPLDRYQTTAAGLLGPVSVNVTAGKVYVYRSEDLFSAPNPTPFLQIRLQGTTCFSTGIVGLLGSNVTANPLFGYSVAVTQDLNGDNKADLIVGSPAYLGIELLSAQSGAAFVYYSDDLATTSPEILNTPDPTLLGLISLPVANTNGLLFGFSVDGAGDYNNDGHPDVVVGAPAGIDLSSLGGIFTGQVLGGSAYVYFGNGTAISNNSGAKLQANVSGLLSNAANLFGYKVKGAENANGVKLGNILVGAPVGAVLSNVLNGLRVKAGQVHVFTKKTGATGTYASDQIIASPRSSSILSILAGRTINVSLLYGSSIDNMLDVNCDNIGDIIVGEPLSTAVPLLGADVVGGAAYVYIGKPDGTYNAAAIWDLYTNVSPLLGVNATSLIGYSVAGAGYVKGRVHGVRSLVGGPSNALDFGIGLLNLGNTLGTTFDFVFDDNGLGKSYSYSFTSCNITTLPATLVEFKAVAVNKTVAVNWDAVTEYDLSHYELERSVDGIHYEKIALVFAKNAQRSAYAYIDQHPFKGINYYRLRVIDKDTRFTYSAVATIKFDDKISAHIVVAPNPVQNDINVRMTGLDKGTYRIEMVNATGQRFITKNVNVSQHLQIETIPRLGSIPDGIYLLNIYNSLNERVKTINIFLTR